MNQLLDNSSSPTSSPSSSSLLEFVSSLLSSLPPSYFQRQVLTDKSQITQLQRLKTKFNRVIAVVKEKKIEGDICPLLLKRYQDLNYKHGTSQRHLKPWRVTKQIISCLRKLNGPSFMIPIQRIYEGLAQSQCSTAPTDKALCYVGASIIHRMAQLDLLRIHCIRAVHLYMNLIEFGHFLTFYLLLMVMAAELAAEARRHYLVLREAYELLKSDLHQLNSNFVLKVEDIPFDSDQKERKEGDTCAEWKLIDAFVNSHSDFTNNIVEKFKEEALFELTSDNTSTIEEENNNALLVDSVQKELSATEQLKQLLTTNTQNDNSGRNKFNNKQNRKRNRRGK